MEAGLSDQALFDPAFAANPQYFGRIGGPLSAPEQLFNHSQSRVDVPSSPTP
jgi:hypothetical protein